MSVYDCASVSECEKDRGVEHIVICLLKHKKRYFYPCQDGELWASFLPLGPHLTQRENDCFNVNGLRSLAALIASGSLTPFENLAIDFSYGCKDHRGTKSCFPCIFTSSSNYIFIFHLS